MHIQKLQVSSCVVTIIILHVVVFCAPVSNRAADTSRVSISIINGKRVIRANGLPNHLTGRFPNRGNPNRISAQSYSFTIPAVPRAAGKVSALGLNPFGVAINGVIFDPGAAEWWNRDRRSGWQYEPMSDAVNLGEDMNNAHVQPNGAYHYHGIPTGLLNLLTGGKPKMVLVGWAADGFPIYGPWGVSQAKNANSELKKIKSSYQLKKGIRRSGPGGRYDGTFVEDYEYVAGAGQLDECNGRYGVTPEFPDGIYHYYLTEEFPFIPRQFRGTPDSSFFKRGPGGGRRPPPGFRGRRPPPRPGNR